MSLVVREVALDSLYISPYNVRSDPGDLIEMTDSVKDVGVLEPILVRQKAEEYEVIAGSRRVKAARQAGLATIPASVLELTDVQALLISVIENIQRKDLTLGERVKTYHVLQQLDAEYRSHRSLAKVTGLSHRKIGEDFQAYEIALKLQPHGIRVESDFPRSSPERQSGEILPEYHAVLLHQAISYLVETGSVPEEEADEQLVKLAHLIVPLSQAAAKELIEQVKAGEPPAQGSLRHIAAEHAPIRQFKAGRHSASRRSTAKRREEAGFITCSCCNRVLKLIHWADGRHTVVDTPITRYPIRANCGSAQSSSSHGSGAGGFGDTPAHIEADRRLLARQNPQGFGYRPNPTNCRVLGEAGSYSCQS